MPAILWLSTCNYVPPCQNQTVDAPGFTVGRENSLYADCQRINIAHVNPTNSALRFARSNDAGRTWYLTDVESGADLGYDSEIFARGNEVFIVHQDADNLNNRFAYSPDSGKTWTTSQMNDSAFDTSSNSAIVVNGDGIWVVLSYLGVQLYHSTNKGQSWNVIVAEGDNNKGIDPSILVDGDRIFIAHHEQGLANDLFVSRSLDRGSTWETFTVQTTDDVGSFSSIVMLDGVLYISFRDFTNLRFLLARSDDMGATWTSSVIDESADMGSESQLATDGSVLYASYRDLTNSTLKIARSLDGGNSWDIRIPDPSPNIGRYTGLGVAGPGLYVAHQDTANSSLKLVSGQKGAECLFP